MSVAYANLGQFLEFCLCRVLVQLRWSFVFSGKEKPSAVSTTFPVCSVQAGRQKFDPSSSNQSSSLRPNMRFRCFLCNGGYKLEKCEQFSAKSSEDKLKFVWDRKLCENCLSYAHFANGCKYPRACNVEQCTIKRKHLGSLHDALLASFRRRQEENRDQEPSLSSSSSDMRTQVASVSSSASVMQTQSDHVMKSSISVAEGSQECRTLSIVPVKVKGKGRDENLCLAW